jgi:predicted phage terminase large subunit-like protein
MQVISERKLRAAVWRKSFYEFFKAFWPTVVAERLVLNWHIGYLCHELQIMAERVFSGQPKLYDLVINIPPGSSKSTIVSVLFPAWCWTRMPSLRYIGGSYDHALAMRDSVASRDIVESELYRDTFPEIEMREDQNTKGRFVNKHMGGRIAVSVGSRVTGYHAHIIGVDDPLNAEQALSEADTKKANRWMTNTLPSRGIFKTDTPMILVMQRLAQNDPSGEKLERGGRVKHICIPAELLYDKDGGLLVNVQPPELIKYYRNNLMDPRRLSKRVLKEFEAQMGAYGYAGQYLQDPVPLGGAIFDIAKLKIDEVAPRMVRLIRAWDKASTADAGAWSAGVLIGLDKHDDYWILDVVRGQWAPANRERIIQQTAQLDRAGANGRLVGMGEQPVDVEIILEQEPGSGGVESTQNSIRMLHGYRVLGKKVTGDKEARAYAFASQVGVQDHVHVLNRPWTKLYIEELKFFPMGRYKDQVDASSLGFNRIAKPKRVVGAGFLQRR